MTFSRISSQILVQDFIPAVLGLGTLATDSNKDNRSLAITCFSCNKLSTSLSLMSSRITKFNLLFSLSPTLTTSSTSIICSVTREKKTYPQFFKPHFVLQLLYRVCLAAVAAAAIMMMTMMVTTKPDLCHVNWCCIILHKTCLKNLKFYNMTIPNTIHILFFIQKLKITNTTHKLKYKLCYHLFQRIHLQPHKKQHH